MWVGRALFLLSLGGANPCPSLSVRRVGAEFIGTFWLVFGGTGSAVLAASVGDAGIGWLGVSLAFGLTVVTGAYALGHVSGAHFNPAVSLGLWAGGRLPARDLLPYIVGQVAGGIAASAVLYAIASGRDGFTLADGFAANGFGEHSPAGYSLLAVIVAEVVLTAVFLIVIHGATDKLSTVGLAPLAIGLRSR
jgi:aquaporin Z